MFPYCGPAANTEPLGSDTASLLADTDPKDPILHAKRADTSKPSASPLSLIDKALSYLIPFESPKAKVASLHERRELLDLLDTHRLTLSPYLDIDRVERHLLSSSSTT